MKEILLPSGHIVLVDDADYDLVTRYKWHASTTGKHGNKYAQRLEHKMIRMHRFLLGVPDGVFIDHINGNGLDNRRENLRVATPRQNRQNSKREHNSRSPYKGVRETKQSRWAARICVNGKQLNIGTFGTALEAAIAYDLAALLYFGEFARLNLPPHPSVAPFLRKHEAISSEQMHPNAQQQEPTNGRTPIPQANAEHQ